MAVFQHLNLNKLSSVEQEIYRFVVNNLEKTLYLIFDYPYKYYTFKHFEV